MVEEMKSFIVMASVLFSTEPQSRQYDENRAFEYYLAILGQVFGLLEESDYDRTLKILNTRDETLIKKLY